jgi:hypothetical protein
MEMESTKPGLARGLEWLSFGLGFAEIAAPSALARLIGIDGNGRTREVLRALGARGLASAAVLDRRPRMGAWSRVAGDAMDLALLGLAAITARRDSKRLAIAIGAVLGIAALDVFTARRLGRGQRTEKAITINASVDEVRAFLADEARMQGVLTRISEADVIVRQAPGQRGAEVCIAVNGPAPGLGTELRHLKQLIELGEIVQSGAKEMRP